MKQIEKILFALLLSLWGIVWWQHDFFAAYDLILAITTVVFIVHQLWRMLRRKE